MPADTNERPPMSRDVTVVMPVYNASPFLPRSLASVAAQTVRPVRIIIADDQSPDDSADVARAVAESLNYPNLNVVTLPRNGGCGAARNFGVLSADTEWLAFLDADDEWEPTFLEEVLDGMEKFGAGFGSSGGVRKLEYKNPPTTSTRLLDGPAEAMDLTDRFWRQALKFMPIHPSALVIRRSLFNEVGGWCGEVRNGEDTPLFAEAWRQSRFVFVNKPLFTSVAPMTGVSAAFIPYHDIRISLGRIGRSAIRSLFARKRGSGWFFAWWLTAVARRHALWFVRRFKLGKLIGRVRSRGAASARP